MASIVQALSVARIAEPLRLIMNVAPEAVCRVASIVMDPRSMPPLPIAITIRRVDPDAVRPLRAAILRPGRPAIESEYPFDEHHDAAHFGAFDSLGSIVGSASVFHEAGVGEHVPINDRERDPWRGPNAWRLRGMTVIEPMRGTGCGATLLHAAIDHVTHHRGDCLWFQARLTARGFYERFGFAAVGDVYDSPHIGEHLFMWRAIDPASPSD